MKKISNFFLLLSVLLCASNLYAVDGTGSTNVTVEDPLLLTLTESTSLSFGTISASDRNGTYTISPISGNTSSSYIIVSNSGNHAMWDINGVPNTNVNITIPTSSILVSNGSSSMTVNDFHRHNTASTLNNIGSMRIWLGATLNVNANQPAGSYSGNYNITVSYQ